MQLWIIGTLCISALRINVPTVEAKPLGSRMESGFAFYRPVGEQSPQFAEGIRDWFRNMKNRLFSGTDPQSLPPPEAANMMMELESEDSQERRRVKSGGFFLDLTRLTFDPDRDWGFRLGQWYFIRKSYNNDQQVPADWGPSNYPEWPTMDEGTVDATTPPQVVTKPIDVMTTVASIPDIELPKVTESSVVPEPKVADNETHIRTESVQSAEVLIPSE